VQAYFWFTLAAVQGSPEVAKIRDGFERRMTVEEVAAAQTMARDWKPKNAK
jgi:hypothetical protein